MKFDPYSWQEVQPNEEIEFQKGVLRVRCSQSAPLYISAQGFQALAGVATEHVYEVSETVTFSVAAKAGVRVFLYTPEPTSVASTGEVFTNIDRMPDESGAVAEVIRARRMLEFERRAMLTEMRETHQALLAEVRASGAPDPTIPVPTEELPVPDSDVLPTLEVME